MSAVDEPDGTSHPRTSGFRIPPKVLVRIIGTTAVLLAADYREWVSASDRVESKKAGLTIYRDSLSDVLSVPPAALARFNETKARTLARGTQVDTKAGQFSAKQWALFAEEAMQDSAQMSVLAAVPRYAVWSDYLRAFAKSIGAEHAYYLACTKTCPDDGRASFHSLLLLRGIELSPPLERRRRDSLAVAHSVGALETSLAIDERKASLFFGGGIVLAITWIFALLVRGSQYVDEYREECRARSLVRLKGELRPIGYGNPSVQRATSRTLQTVRRVIVRALRGVGNALISPTAVHIMAFVFALTPAVLAHATKDMRWWWAELPCLTFLLVMFYQPGAARVEFERAAARIYATFAGNLDELTTELQRSEDASLRSAFVLESSAQLLARIRALVDLVLSRPGHIQLRATLALPIIADDGSLVAMKVHAYDGQYENRNYSEIPAGFIGSPAAFQSRSIEIISDLAEVPVSQVIGRRDFRSVVAIPILVDGSRGTVLGVVCVDATAPRFFTPERVKRITPFVMPIIKSMALVLLHAEE